MALITLRASTTSLGPASTSAKTSPLTNAEIDNNFINLNADSALRMVVGTPWVSGGAALLGQIIYYSTTLISATPTINYYQVTVAGTFTTTAPSHTTGSATNGTATLAYIAKPNYNGTDILTQLKLVDGVSSGLDSDLLRGLASTNANTASTVVVRDGVGSFAANIISANGFTGPLTGNVYAADATLVFNATTKAFVGNVTGNVTNTTGGSAVYTNDTGTVSNTMLAGSIANSKLANSSMTINGVSVALGGTVSISGAANTWTALQTFRDTLFSITDDGDTTKVLQFQVGSIATNTVRTLSIPSADGTIATVEYVQTAGQNSQGAKTVQAIATGVPSNATGNNGDIIYQY